MELGRNTDFSSVFERCLIRGSNTYGITRQGRPRDAGNANCH